MSAPASTPVSVAVGGSAPLTASCRKKARHAAALQALRQRSAALLNEDQSGITITVEGKKGRSAIAIRDLPPGHELIHEASAGWVLRSDESSNGFCSECCREYQRPTYPPCCAYVAYCSNGCLIDASSLHIFICPLLSKIPFISSQTQCDPDMIRLVVHLVAGYLREQEMVKKNGTIDRQKARWLHVQDLVSHLDSADPVWLSSITRCMKSLHTEYLSQPFFTSSYDLPDVSTLIELCCRINSNSHGIFDNYASTNRVIGLGLFPTTSILNHSCTPNAFFSCAGGGEMVVRTLRAVKKGEELTVPYCDLYQARFERQKELWHDKHFLCACIRCKVDERPTALSKSTSELFVPSTDQILSWSQVGAIQCPACKKRQHEQVAWLDEDESNGKKKKKKKATKPAATSVEEATSSMAAVSIVAAPTNLVTLPALPSFPSHIGLISWRGSVDEVKQAGSSSSSSSAAAAAPKSWHCSSPSCGGKFTAGEIDEMLQPILVGYEACTRLKSSRKYADALKAYLALLDQCELLLAPLHALYTSILTPALNLSRHLEQWSVSESMVGQLLARMERIFPSNLPEQSDFYVVLGEILQERAKAITGNSDKDLASKREIGELTRRAYGQAYQIRLIACGIDHPRTLAIPNEFRTNAPNAQ